MTLPWCQWGIRVGGVWHGKWRRYEVNGQWPKKNCWIKKISNIIGQMCWFVQETSNSKGNGVNILEETSHENLYKASYIDIFFLIYMILLGPKQLNHFILYLLSLPPSHSFAIRILKSQATLIWIVWSPKGDLRVRKQPFDGLKQSIWLLTYPTLFESFWIRKNKIVG